MSGAARNEIGNKSIARVLPGAPTVLINDMPVLRVGDIVPSESGEPSRVTSGATGVIIGDRRVARMGDPTIAASGEGSISRGSHNVVIGNYVAENKSHLKEWFCVVLRYANGNGIADITYRVSLPDGRLCQGATDATGEIFIDRTVKGDADVRVDDLQLVGEE